MNPHEPRQPGIHLLLHQRGVEMTGVDDNKVGIGHASGRLRAIVGRRLRYYDPDGAKRGSFSSILSSAGFFSSPPRLRVTAKKAQSAMA
jgi:hypothetical protein